MFRCKLGVCQPPTMARTRTASPIVAPYDPAKLGAATGDPGEPLDCVGKGHRIDRDQAAAAEHHCPVTTVMRHESRRAPTHRLEEQVLAMLGTIRRAKDDVETGSDAVVFAVQTDQQHVRLHLACDHIGCGQALAIGPAAAARIQFPRGRYGQPAAGGWSRLASGRMAVAWR